MVREGELPVASLSGRVGMKRDGQSVSGVLRELGARWQFAPLQVCIRVVRGVWSDYRWVRTGGIDNSWHSNHASSFGVTIIEVGYKEALRRNQAANRLEFSLVLEPGSPVIEHTDALALSIARTLIRLVKEADRPDVWHDEIGFSIAPMTEGSTQSFAFGVSIESQRMGDSLNDLLSASARYDLVRTSPIPVTVADSISPDRNYLEPPCDYYLDLRGQRLRAFFFRGDSLVESLPTDE